jgi:hypothetical protein
MTGMLMEWLLPDGSGMWGALVRDRQSGSYTVVIRGLHTLGSFDVR